MQGKQGREKKVASRLAAAVRPRDMSPHLTSPLVIKAAGVCMTGPTSYFFCCIKGIWSGGVGAGRTGAVAGE